ncbi:uncharacterized protein [Cicer arietinum]|uniref:uncharacterized protein n=1 Tax=Cicer arietinum TaxID=3827 RepID=UPI003CC552E2
MPLVPYKPPIPFSQRFTKAKIEEQFRKFVELLKKVNINISLTEALSQMPSYAKFLKEILSNKRKLDNNETIALIKESSAIIQNKFPPKLKDRFSIPCVIGDISFERALRDFGASVSLMPLLVCKKLDVDELKSTKYFLQLADGSIKYLMEILEDVLTKVGYLFISTDFVVLEMEEDSQVPILLGRTFLATSGAVIDVKYGKLVFNVGDEKIEFNLSNLMKSHSLEYSLKG